jgi:hypothetical protein
MPPGVASYHEAFVPDPETSASYHNHQAPWLALDASGTSSVGGGPTVNADQEVQRRADQEVQRSGSG